MICEKEKKGIEAEEDTKIAAIRWIKRNVFHNEQGGKLVVCKECYPKYVELRKKYEKRQVTYIAIMVVFALLAIIVARNLAALEAIILLGVFLYLLDFMNYLTYRAVKLKKGTPT